MYSGLSPEDKFHRLFQHMQMLNKPKNVRLSWFYFSFSIKKIVFVWFYEWLDINTRSLTGTNVSQIHQWSGTVYGSDNFSSLLGADVLMLFIGVIEALGAFCVIGASHWLSQPWTYSQYWSSFAQTRWLMVNHNKQVREYSCREMFNSN